MRRREEPVSTEIEPGRRYTGSELDAIATQLLREDANSELCRECEAPGKETGEVRPIVQALLDESGRPLVTNYVEFECESGHKWFNGEGRRKTIQGDNPILFEEHFQSRKRREIYTKDGTPDPNIVSGIYNRTHPEGRKVNSEEQRRRNGASFFR